MLILVSGVDVKIKDRMKIRIGTNNDITYPNIQMII